MHLKYLSYVLRHKWYVFLECLKYKLIWQGIVHDLSKFSRSEWSAYVLSFYGPWKYDERPDWLVTDFDLAWLHHQHNNAHHWQHYLLMEDSGDLKIMEIPWNYRAEMVCDWKGAGKALGKPDTKAWYLANRDKIILAEHTRAWVEDELGVKHADKEKALIQAG